MQSGLAGSLFTSFSLSTAPRNVVCSRIHFKTSTSSGCLWEGKGQISLQRDTGTLFWVTVTFSVLRRVRVTLAAHICENSPNSSDKIHARHCVLIYSNFKNELWTNAGF